MRLLFLFERMDFLGSKNTFSARLEVFGDNMRMSLKKLLDM